MNNTLPEARALTAETLKLLLPLPEVEVALCPPFTALSLVKELLCDTRIALGAQDIFWKSRGAYTGQISPPMLVDIGCSYVIVGHSERRGRFGVPEQDFDEAALAHFGDSDATVNRKLIAALTAGITPVCCVGETLVERREHRAEAVVRSQVLAALRDVGTPLPGVVFAYEPVWAIGTGETCAASDAGQMCGMIRQTVAAVFGGAAGEAVRVLYGGSVKPESAVELLEVNDIDGALVGGASLKAAEFAAIVNAAVRARYSGQRASSH